MSIIPDNYIFDCNLIKLIHIYYFKVKTYLLFKSGSHAKY